MLSWRSDREHLTKMCISFAETINSNCRSTLYYILKFFICISDIHGQSQITYVTNTQQVRTMPSWTTSELRSLHCSIAWPKQFTKILNKIKTNTKCHMDINILYLHVTFYFCPFILWFQLSLMSPPYCFYLFTCR